MLRSAGRARPPPRVVSTSPACAACMLRASAVALRIARPRRTPTTRRPTRKSPRPTAVNCFSIGACKVQRSLGIRRHEEPRAAAVASSSRGLRGGLTPRRAGVGSCSRSCAVNERRALAALRCHPYAGIGRQRDARAARCEIAFHSCQRREIMTIKRLTTAFVLGTLAVPACAASPAEEAEATTQSVHLRSLEPLVNGARRRICNDAATEWGRCRRRLPRSSASAGVLIRGHRRRLRAGPRLWPVPRPLRELAVPGVHEDRGL